MTLIDSHAHLELFEELEEVLGRAKRTGLTTIITIGTSLETSKRAVQIAERFSGENLKIYATCGIHPNDGAEEVQNLGLSEVMGQLKKIAKSSKKVVGIGECGLDYYEKSDKQSFSANKRQETGEKEKEFQGKLFIEQVTLANELDLPVVVHCRNGWGEIFELLTINNKQLTNLKGVFHSFTGGVNEAKKATGLGFYVSFSGIVTFKNAPLIQEAATKIPSDSILVETDSPYLAPEPFRGQKNEPANVRIVAEFLAKLKGVPFDNFSDMTSKNAAKLFNL